MYKGISDKVAKADRQVRATHTGKPVDEVMRVARRVFASIGLSMGDNGLREYSESVSADKDFKIVIK